MDEAVPAAPPPTLAADGPPVPPPPEPLTESDVVALPPWARMSTPAPPVRMVPLDHPGLTELAPMSQLLEGAGPLGGALPKLKIPPGPPFAV